MKNLLLSLWKNHRKKVLAAFAAVALAAASYFSGVPVSELKDAVNAAPSIGVEAPASPAAE